jgi:Fur family ferric uptake transcriptional regulator
VSTDPDLHDVIAGRLAEREQLYTSTRRAVVDVLATAAAPITLPEVLHADSSLAQSSAYRSLAVLTDAGVVRRLLHGTDHAHFELGEHLTGHHHHLICEACGVVIDVTLPDDVESAMDETFDQVAGESDFVAHSHAVDIYGLCATCR